MAEIRPLRAWKYNQYLTEKLFELTASISETKFKQKEAALYQTPYHNFHIASPMDVPPYENVARRIHNWKLDKVILQDRLMAIYPYYQSYQPTGAEDIIFRKGFVCFIKLAEYDEKIILPHEKTFSEAVNYRKSVLEYTLMNSTPTHGIYADKNTNLAQYMDESIQNPFAQVIDENQVKHCISMIQDEKVIKEFTEAIKDKQIIIADGHHRYESSLAYAKERQSNNPNHTGNENYNYHLMWLTNSEEGDAGILPTHRIIHSIPDFDRTIFLNQLAEYFTIEKQESSNDLLQKPYEKAWAFGLVFKDENYYIRLRPEVMAASEKEWNIPPTLKDLDISVLHHFIIEKILKLNESNHFKHLEFEQYSEKCVQRIQKGEGIMAILTHKISIPEIQNVCKSGYTMPQKATYFYPKVLSGLLFGSVGDKESNIIT